ncbi:MAG: hypothetical protein AB7O28_24430 [Vicinamibacterales bacterium]
MVRQGLLAAAAFVCGAGFATMWTAPAAAQDRQTTTKELTRVDLGAWCPGKEVVITHLTNSPGSSGRHSHPAYSFSYVLEGVQVVTPDGKAPYTARTGDLQFEAPYAVSATRTAEPSKVVTFRILEKGKPATIPAP